MSWKEPKVSLTPRATLQIQDIHPQDIKPEIKDLLYFANHATALRNSQQLVAPDEGASTATASTSTTGSSILPTTSTTTMVKVETSAGLSYLPSSSAQPLSRSSVLMDDCAIMPPPPPPLPRPLTSPGVSSTSEENHHPSGPNIGNVVKSSRLQAWCPSETLLKRWCAHTHIVVVRPASSSGPTTIAHSSTGTCLCSTDRPTDKPTSACAGCTTVACCLYTLKRQNKHGLSLVVYILRSIRARIYCMQCQAELHLHGFSVVTLGSKMGDVVVLKFDCSHVPLLE